MGNVDTLHRVVKEANAKWGPDSGSGSLHKIFQLYQYDQIKHKLDSFETFRQLQDTMKESCSFNAFLFYMLSDKDNFRETIMQDSPPGLHESINCGQ